MGQRSVKSWRTNFESRWASCSGGLLLETALLIAPLIAVGIGLLNLSIILFNLYVLGPEVHQLAVVLAGNNTDAGQVQTDIENVINREGRLLSSVVVTVDTAQPQRMQISTSAVFTPFFNWNSGSYSMGAEFVVYVP